MNYEFYDDMSEFMPYMNNNISNNLELFNPYEGFLKGNAFKNEYIPYKNYKVSKINFNSEKDELLFNISELCFVMHEMNLYLDVNPDNIEARNKFNEYRNKVNELTIQYERKYGPLEVIQSSVKQSFNWLKEWPWVN